MLFLIIILMKEQTSSLCFVSPQMHASNYLPAWTGQIESGLGAPPAQFAMNSNLYLFGRSTCGSQHGTSLQAPASVANTASVTQMLHSHVS